MKNQKICSVTAEQGLIGALLLDHKVYTRIACRKLIPDDFQLDLCREVYTLIERLAAESKPWDTVVIGKFLKPESMASLIELAKNTPGTSNAEAYAEIVKERSIRRKIVEQAVLIEKKAYDPFEQNSDELLAFCMSTLSALRDSHLVSNKQSQSLNNSVLDFLAYIMRRRESDSVYEGILSLMPSIDSLTGGFCGGHLIVIAARPSVGKSAYGLFCASRALMQGKHVLFWSTEMNNHTILARMFSQLCSIPAYNLTHAPKYLLDKHIEQISESSSDFETLYVESGYAKVKTVCDKARVMHKQGKLDLLIVDYLQNLQGEGEGTVERLGHVSTSLKKLAMELDIPVIALAQLNRQAQHMDVPSMAEIKGSGAIEQDADLVLLLHRNPEEGEEKHWLICAKNRHGETKNIPILFEKSYQNFKEDDAAGRFLTKAASKRGGFSL